MNRRGSVITVLCSLLMLTGTVACGQQPGQGQRDAVTPVVTNHIPEIVPSPIETISSTGSAIVPQPVISAEPPLNKATEAVHSTAIVQRTSTAQAYTEALRTSISASATALIVQAPTLTAQAINHYNALHPQPQSPPAEMNKPYPYALYTHCGVDYSTDFDGSFWDAADTASLPPSLGNPLQTGTMTLLDESHVRFDFDGGSVLFVRHQGPKVLPGFCA